MLELFESSNELCKQSDWASSCLLELFFPLWVAQQNTDLLSTSVFQDLQFNIMKPYKIKGLADSRSKYGILSLLW